MLTFNARGIGKSQGSQPWPGGYPGSDHLDFAAVEEAGRELTGAGEVYRLVSVIPSARLPRFPPWVILTHFLRSTHQL